MEHAKFLRVARIKRLLASTAQPGQGPRSYRLPSLPAQLLQRNKVRHSVPLGVCARVVVPTSTHEEMSALESQRKALRNSRFVLKIHNGADANQFPLAQAEALESLARQGIACPVDHQRGVYLQDHFVRLLDYVPGELLFHHPHKTLEMYFALGEFLAGVDIGLKASHVADKHDVVKSRELQWDLRYFAQLEFFVNSLSEQGQRQVCLNTLREFAKLNSEKFQLGLVHNDANDRNLLVMAEGGGFAIIDFGDMVYTWLVSEVAIAMAYVVVGWFTDHPSDGDGVWLDRVGALFKGYRAIVPLSPQEVDALERGLFTRARQARLGLARGIGQGGQDRFR
ncbi:hypothetical protein BASA81_006821 [Batrachochytrium salamandrivorans]|nr:hypothetical protein BASA81_006821 [Batrachochytrium salamandrivorans]